MSNLVFLFYLTLLLCWLGAEIMLAVRVVNVTSDAGTFVGSVKDVSFNGEKYSVAVFLGIPYAEPPTGAKRFKKPSPMPYLKSPYNATYHRAACLQKLDPNLRTLTYDENCLFLNIYAPITAMKHGNKSFSVLVWIHGGFFVSGAADYYVADTLAAVGDVIFVSMNYRLAGLGFVGTGDETVPGNYGLWDQQLAIQWVHNNIRYFGGNTDNVTLIGQSAGSASVIYQSLFPNNRGLFQRIIAESGSAVAPWALRSKETARTLGRLVGCLQNNIVDLVQCLKEVGSDIYQKVFNNPSFPEMTFLPTVDGHFLKRTPKELLSDQSCEEFKFFSSLDILTGFNNMEGIGLMLSAWPAALNLSDTSTFPVSRGQFENIVVPNTITMLSEGESRKWPKTFHHLINFQYTNWSNPHGESSNRDMLLTLSTDVAFAVPAIETLRAHCSIQERGRSFLYVFTVQPFLLKFFRPSWASGASHIDEMAYVFGYSKRALNSFKVPMVIVPPLEEILLAEKVIKWWTNFAKYGDPNGGFVTEAERWPEYNNDSHAYFQITNNKPVYGSTKHKYGEPRMTFWLDVVPTLLGKKITSAVTSMDTPVATEPTTDDRSTLPSSVPYRNEAQVSGIFGLTLSTSNNVIISLIVLSSCLLLALVLTCICFVRRKNFIKKETQYKL